MVSGRYHWSNAAPPAAFGKINAVAAIPWLVVILHPSWWALYFALGVSAVLIYIELYKKMTLKSFAREVNIWVTGRVKSTVNLVKELAR